MYRYNIYYSINLQKLPTTSRALSPVTVVGFVDMAAEPPPHLPPEPGRSHDEQENGVAEPSTGDFTANFDDRAHTLCCGC